MWYFKGCIDFTGVAEPHLHFEAWCKRAYRQEVSPEVCCRCWQNVACSIFDNYCKHAAGVPSCYRRLTRPDLLSCLSH